MNDINLSNVSYSHGRIVLSGSQFDSKKNRGVNAYGWLGKIVADAFGSGTVEVKVNNKTVYLNRNSCYKLVYNHPTIDKTSAAYKAFMSGTSDDIIGAVQNVFNQKKEAAKVSFDAAEQQQWKTGLDSQEQAFFSKLSPVEQTVHQVIGQQHDKKDAAIADGITALFQGRVNEIQQVPGTDNRYALELNPGKGEIKQDDDTIGVKLPSHVELEHTEDGKWKIHGDVEASWGLAGFNLNGVTCEMTPEGKMRIDPGALSAILPQEVLDRLDLNPDLLKPYLGENLVNWK